MRPVDIQAPACERAFPGARVLQLRSAQVLGTRNSRLGLTSIAIRLWTCRNQFNPISFAPLRNRASPSRSKRKVAMKSSAR
ncbi:MAG: hypothetical protein E5X96_02775 [Mesorhizobium sp.]|nr:MAG: hypothetical protein E5X96_02775 [Mesorhizobium sp.]